MNRTHHRWWALARRFILSRPSLNSLLVFTLLLFAGSASAQMNTGTLSGIVADQSARAIPVATLVATQAATGRKFTTVTNGFGDYLLTQLPAGAYQIVVSADGFNKAVQPNIEVHAGEQLRQSFSLKVGPQDQEIVVTAITSQLQVESAAIQDTVTQAQVIELPLKSRLFIDLVGLTPGITHAPAGTRGGALQQTGPTWGILGQRGGHNLYLVDGVNATDEFYNNLVLSPSVDDIQEVNIDGTSYDAEFGGKSGGVINVITKSGTNRVHGSLFEFVRNDMFDARNYFDSHAQPIPPYKQNQFGASLGGPIQKDRTFFFINYEGERIRQSETQLFTVPTDRERLGSFQGTGIVVKNPSTGNAYPNDTIPNIDPVAAAILAKFPHATSSAQVNNLQATDLSTSDITQYNARIDHTFSDSDSLFIRGSVFEAREFNPFGLSALNEALLPGFGYNLRTHTDNIAASWSHIFNPSWVNELRFGWMWVGGGQTSPNSGAGIAAQTGLQGVTTNPLDMGYPQATVAGFTTMGEPTQYVSRKDSNYELYDNVVWHEHAHTVKFGAYFFHLNFDPVDANNARGLFQFTNKYTGNALGDFLLGDPTQAQVGLGRGTLQGRSNWLHAYFEDGWQVSPDIKLDIGLRYEYNQNLTDTNNDMAIVDTLAPGGRFVIASDSSNQISPAANALLSNIPIPYVTSREIGWNRSLLTSRPVRLAPRIGLAWTLPDHDTVVRSGFGIYTNQAAYSIIQNAALNLPFYFAKTVANTGVSVPVFTIENILAAPANGSVSANNIVHDFKIEYNDVWNLAVQRRLSSSTSFQAEYIGSYTVHADNQGLQNLFPGGLPSANPLHVRPIPQMSGFTSIVWDGWEKYHALTLSLDQRAWRGLLLEANYTWSKALDDASNPGADNAGPNVPQDPTNLAAEKGLSDFDHRQRLVVNFLYDLPFLKDSQGWVRTAFAGWEAGGILTLESGSPFTVNISTDNANNGTPVQSQRPNLVCNPNNGPKTTAQWFATSCFASPASLAYGNAGRDIVIGPGLADFDATFQKVFVFRERATLQFRADMFDFFNHPNFKQPNRIFSATPSNFGTISSSQDPRVMQLSLRLAF